MENEENVNIDDVGATSIYEGGALSTISVNDLLNNETAIRQLVNEHNLSTQKLSNKETEIENYKAEIEYLKTSPFVAIFAAIINIIGAIFLGVSVNLITNNTSQESQSYIPLILLITAALLILAGSLVNILYPYARNWFNQK
ncbi:hypothetical protein GF354_01975 [Candidatus Peregrinibacteria bacterium]|nr:hypothetical protein [Candidatus Peregrinibacteria bacterium]